MGKSRLYLQSIQRNWILFILLMSSTLGYPQLSGGGELNPSLKAPVQAQEKWRDLKIGISIHWGPSSLGGEEISWSRHKIIDKNTYDNYYKKFNPNRFDANEWIWLFKRWGMKFVSPTAKHHDGFALWFSDYTDYDMENAALRIDIMQELSEACKNQGFVLGTYYSNIDWYHPDWSPNEFGGPGVLIKPHKDSPNMERYMEYMTAQCEELITKYNVSFIQFDGEWDDTYTHQMGSKLYRYLRSLDSNLLMSTRIDKGRVESGKDDHIAIDGKKYAGDFQDRERLVNHGNNVTAWGDHLWQAWVTIDKTQWSYNQNPELMSAKELIMDMIKIVGNNGNYMINLGPKPDGSFENDQVMLMDSLGKWLHTYGYAIYDSRGGPYPSENMVSTRKANKAWLFVLEPDVDTISLPKLHQKVQSARYVDNHQLLELETEDKSIAIKLPRYQTKYDIRVVELLYTKEVGMMKKP